MLRAFRTYNTVEYGSTEKPKDAKNSLLASVGSDLIKNNNSIGNG